MAERRLWAIATRQFNGSFWEAIHCFIDCMAKECGPPRGKSREPTEALTAAFSFSFASEHTP